MSQNRDNIIAEIVKYSLKLDSKGFGANHDGNISAKFADFFLATPTAVSKGNVTTEMVLTLDQAGNKLAGQGKPFSELKLHLAAYEARPEANAIVHAHPPFAMARGLVGKGLEIIVPEAVVSIGAYIPVMGYALPGTPESITQIQSALTQTDVFMLPGNGVFAIGADVEQAYLRLELVEHLAKIDFYAQSMGVPQQLPSADQQELLAKRASLGLGPKNPPPANPPEVTDTIRELVAKKLRELI